MTRQKLVSDAIRRAREFRTATARGRSEMAKRLCNGRHNKAQVLALGLRLLADYEGDLAYEFLRLVAEDEERRRGTAHVFPRGAKGGKGGDS